jgi:hypothetical protein
MGLKKRTMTPPDGQRYRAGEANRDFRVSGKKDKCLEREKDCGKCKIRECPEEKL